MTYGHMKTSLVIITREFSNYKFNLHISLVKNYLGSNF